MEGESTGKSYTYSIFRRASRTGIYCDFRSLSGYRPAVYPPPTSRSLTRSAGLQYHGCETRSILTTTGNSHHTREALIIIAENVFSSVIGVAVYIDDFIEHRVTSSRIESLPFERMIGIQQTQLVEMAPIQGSSTTSSAAVTRLPIGSTS